MENLSLEDTKQAPEEEKKQAFEGPEDDYVSDDSAETQEKKSRKYVQYKLNIKHSSHAEALLEDILASDNGYVRCLTDQCDFQYVSPSTDNADILELLTKHKNKLVNRYPNIKDLCRKDQFKTMMDLACQVDPDAFDFVPPSFTLPADKDRF